MESIFFGGVPMMLYSKLNISNYSGMTSIPFGLFLICFTFLDPERVPR